MTFSRDLQVQLAEEAAAKANYEREQAESAALLAQAVADGPDVSQFQPTVNFPALAAGFAFVRTSDGNDVDDSWNGARVASLRQASYPFGPYHFGRCAAPVNNERNGRIEAGMAIFFAQNNGWKSGDLRLAYDFENNPPPSDSFLGQPPAKAAKHLMQFVKTYEWIMQHTPIIYSNPKTLKLILPELTDADKSLLGTCPLWIAHWGAVTPEVLLPWTDWTFWQYTNQGSLPNLSPVDLNHFSGSRSDLDALRIT
jgi:GH25 family lysozyme M1 (1,4-beta-N-acetylmuramidase)